MPLDRPPPDLGRRRHRTHPRRLRRPHTARANRDGVAGPRRELRVIPAEGRIVPTICRRAGRRVAGTGRRTSRPGRRRGRHRARCRGWCLVRIGLGHAGAGAAIGAGAGLLSGTLLGSAAVRNRYNIAYTQCMDAKGERVAWPAPRPVVYAVPPPPVVYVPAPVYPAPPAS